MIKYLFFKGKTVTKGKDLEYKIPKKGEHLLIFLTRPVSKEITKVAMDFELDPVPLTVYDKEMHSRRFVTKPFQFVMRTAYLSKNNVSYTNLLFILTERALIVSSSRPSEFYDEILEDIADSFQKTAPRSVAHILYNFLQEDVDENYDVLGYLEKKIRDVESRACKLNFGKTHVKVNEILTLKKKLFKLSRQFWASTRIISLIRIGVAKIHIDPASERLLGDVHETFLHQIDLAATQKEMVSDVLNVYSTTLSNISALQSNELNVVMKKLTSYAAILLVPTLVASIYGMNFEWLPLARNDWGFFLTIGLMFAFTAVTFIHFKKNDWV